MATIIPENDPRAADWAVEALKAGELVVLPTDTVYGLAAVASNDNAVRHLYAAKNRPLSKAVPLFVADSGMASWVADLTPVANSLISAFWPGALTIVMRKAKTFRSVALGGADTVALRVPDYNLVRNVVRAVGEPVTGTSANRSGARSPVSASEAAFQLGTLVALVIDGGPVGRAVESTVLDITRPEGATILREGAVTREDLKRVLGERLAA